MKPASITTEPMTVTNRDSGVSPNLARYAWLSLATALLTLAIKLLAWRLSGSVGLLSDALETVVNVAAALMALTMLRLAARPPDAGHAYGHGKAEYFSSAFEGAMIVIACALIVEAAWPRIWHPQPLDLPLPGLALAVVAGIINLVVSRVLFAAGRQHDSITLRADAGHLRADVWTTAGVVCGVALDWLTGWHQLDALVALGVALHILWTGWKLLAESFNGLMDPAWPEGEQKALDALLDDYRQRHGIAFHAVRTRCSGPRRFLSLHVLVPGAWTVQRGHDLAETLERDLALRIPRLTVLSHMEPLEDPLSYADVDLDRHP
jgi:cation diffusion facilitator family transporter